MFNHALAYVLATLAAPKRDEKGVTVVEYALVIGVVSIALIALFATFKTNFKTFLDGITFS